MHKSNVWQARCEVAQLFCLTRCPNLPFFSGCQRTVSFRSRLEEKQILKQKLASVLEKFDLLTDTKKDLDELNKELTGDGVEMFNIEGDIACSSIICLVEKEVLLECDIVYGHQDGHGLLDLNGSVLKQWRPEDLSVRLFKLALVSKPNSPNGFLPNYRFWLMDPESLGALGYNIPCKDGSSHKAMAHSLRELLKQEYKIAIGVHFNGMPREDFRNSVDMAWNWLDQKSLT